MTNWNKKLRDVSTREEVIGIIEEFSREHDNWVNYTFAHIAIDDYNLSDLHIKFCLRQDTINEWFEYALTQQEPECCDPTSANEWERWQYDELTELRDAVIGFLRALLKVEEEVRDE